MEKELDKVLMKFPDFRTRIIELFNGNPDFKSLCEDYWQCLDELTRFETVLRRDHAVKKDFRNLLKALEKEMMGFLQSSYK